MLDKLLLWARNMEASDLHIRPASVPMVRVDGSLQPLQNEFISREKLEKALLALLPEQEKQQLCSQFKETIASVAAALNAGYSVENAWREAKVEMTQLYGEQANQKLVIT